MRKHNKNVFLILESLKIFHIHLLLSSIISIFLTIISLFILKSSKSGENNEKEINIKKSDKHTIIY